MLCKNYLEKETDVNKLIVKKIEKKLQIVLYGPNIRNNNNWDERLLCLKAHLLTYYAIMRERLKE